MAVSLNLDTIVQSNDNTMLRIIDDTGDYSSSNVGGWGAPNTAVTTINGTTNALSVTVTITTSDGTETEYEPIDFRDYLGASPTTADDLVMYITSAMLIPSGDTSAIGDADDELPDGWYKIDYTLYTIATDAVIDTYEIQFVVDGIVRNKIYSMLIAIPTDIYTSTPNRVYVHDWTELTFPLYVLSIFEGMVAYVSNSRKNEILSTLNIIERLTS